MMGKIIQDAGGSITLADVPKAIVAQLHLYAQVDYSDDPQWVAHCLELGCLPSWSKAAKALEENQCPKP